MEATWTDNEVVLVLKREDLGQVHPDVVAAVWAEALENEAVAKAVGQFIALQAAICFQGCLQFLDQK